MKATWLFLTFLASLCVLLPVPSVYAEESSDPVSLLKAMGTYLGTLDEFGFQADVTMAHGEESGQKKTPDKVSVSVKRPNMVHAKVVADHRNREFIYNETLATLIDWDHEVFSRIQVPNTIDSMLDTLSSEYGVTWPLADFLYIAPHEILLEKVAQSSYVGQDKVGTFECHHLKFHQDNVDWQIWIETGEEPLPRNMAISYKNLPQSSQFEGIITNWTTEKPLEEHSFVVEGLENLLPVDFIRVSRESAEK